MSNNSERLGTATGSSNEYEIPADHEIAAQASGFGKFNLILILSMIPATFGTVFSTTTMSYVFPIAQCDLDLTVDNKGLLNSVIYIGMLSSGFFWGFLTDLLGRRKLLIFIYLLEGLIVLLSGFTQKFIYLVIAKFFDGLIITGGLSAILSYTNEFHTSPHRPYIPLINGIVSNIALTLLPLLGWCILTDGINISLLDDNIILTSWNIFLFTTSIPNFIASATYSILPESPKFLMTVGRTEEALKIFRNVFRLNTGNPPDQYPVKILIDESKLNENNKHGGHITPNRTNKQAMKESWQQLKPLFYPPYIVNILMTVTINFGLLLGMNTIRLWIPQLFSAINDYEYLNKANGFDLCNTLALINSGSSLSNGTCFVNYDNSSVYVNNIIISVAAIVINLCSFPFIGKFRKTIILASSGVLSGLCVICLYFSNNIIITIVLLSFNIGCTYISMNVLLGIVIDLFPTSLRTISVALAMMFGRIGSSLGNLVFPKLLSAGCAYPFVTLGSIVIGSSLLGLFLPRIDMKSLQ